MRTLAAIVLLPFFVFITLVTVWTADRDVPVSLKYVWVEPAATKACSTVQIWIDRDAYRQTGLRIEIIMSNVFKQSAIPVSSDTSELRGPLGNYTYGVDLEIPCSFRPGWATIERRVYYYRNPIQQYLWAIKGETKVVPVCIIADGVRQEEVCKKDEIPRRAQ